jgi:hypothetical protein
MDIFSLKSSQQQPQDLKLLVEMLQSALHNHKHHIALEVRNNLLSEFSLSFSTFTQSISQKLSESTSNLDHFLKLSIQSLSHKIQTLESNFQDLSSKLSTLSSDFSSLSHNHSSFLIETKEKLLSLELQSENLKENLKKLQNFSNCLESQNETLSSSVVKNGVSVMSSIQMMVKQQVETHHFECLNWINVEISKIQEKMIRSSLNEVEIGFRVASIDGNFGDKQENHETFKMIDKCLMSLGSLRIRVEKLENSEQICEKFRRSIAQF